MRTSHWLSLSLALAVAFAAPAQAQDEPLLEEAILSFVNDPATELGDLTAAIELGYAYGFAAPGVGDWVVEQAAQAILDHRAGPDGKYGRGNDDPFDTLLELYEVDGVGGEAIEGIEIHVTRNATGAPLGSAILRLVNAADRKTLDVDAGLSDLAAASLVLLRDGGADLKLGTADDGMVPYSRVFGRYHTDGHRDRLYPAHSVDAVPYVGPESIQKLFDFALLSDIGSQSEPVTTEIWNIDDLDSQLRAVVDGLIADGNPFDPSNTFSIRFSKLTVTSIDGVPTSYGVELFQWIDPEGGMYYLIKYTLDASLNVTNVDFSI